MIRRLAFALLLAGTVSTSSCSRAEPQPPHIVALERIAAAGNAEALYHLGMSYQTGAGVTQDKARALDAFRRGAEKGDPLAAYKLATYYNGQGEGLVKPDPAQALRWNLVAAEAGYALAQQDAAALLAQRGDIPAAIGWLEKAVAQGWPEAMLAYASLYNPTGKQAAAGVPRDPVKAAAWYRLFTQTVDADQRQLDWLAAFEKKLTPAQRAQAAAIVAAFKPAPTPMTIKGLSGSRAAAELIDAAAARAKAK